MMIYLLMVGSFIAIGIIGAGIGIIGVQRLADYMAARERLELEPALDVPSAEEVLLPMPYRAPATVPQRPPRDDPCVGVDDAGIVALIRHAYWSLPESPEKRRLIDVALCNLEHATDRDVSDHIRQRMRDLTRDLLSGVGR